MMDVVVVVLIFIGVMAVTSLVFGGWIVVNLFRGIGALLGLNSTRPPQPMGRPMGLGGQPVATNYSGAPVQCKVPGCRHLNPGSARFCRHCGHAFPPAQSAAVRRVAML
jgi:hypothetical protein